MITANVSQREWLKQWNKLQFGVLERNNNMFIWSKKFLLTDEHVIISFDWKTDKCQLTFNSKIGNKIGLDLWLCWKGWEEQFQHKGNLLLFIFIAKSASFWFFNNQNYYLNKLKGLKVVNEDQRSTGSMVNRLRHDGR